MLRRAANIAAVFGFGICVYSFLLGNKFFENKFENDYVAWYFLAKGVFLLTILYLLGIIADKLTEKKE